ncbi:isopentenyl-diphosphate Delta-isomerase [Pilimelia terevasa]|uniref:isopentenyl-diphosphate Delta-isomerase n=1 Tax=Pilimelia terevasa TaxID=53372 RepID=UPI00166D3E14|nr:isopentenyl-diphosphate Delta-isomerase [Pilimelia terevasa]
MRSREQLPVELVDPEGRACGTATVQEAHRPPGRLHRAFSIILLDPDGRILLQRRAATKTRFPGRWANTCCGHPGPGEPVVEAARRRLREELGVEAALAEVGRYSYQAEDPASGLVECEFDHVLRGALAADAPLHPDPAEIDEVRWAELDAVRRAVRAAPHAYAPWLAGVLATLVDA